MYILSAACISPQDTFAHSDAFPSVRILEGNRWACMEPDYKTCIADATLRRRMSRIVKMGVAAALRCVDLAGAQPDAIITATGLGCLSDTEKFLDTLISNERQLNPTPFIQSTFNTVGAQIALMLGNHGYNNTYVHRGFSFESALLDAMMQVNEGAARVLAGCFDETTDTGFEIMQRLGFWKDGLAGSDQLYTRQTKGSASGEGSTFLMLGSQPVKDRLRIRISGVRFFSAPAGNGSVDAQVAAFLASVKKSADDTDLLVWGNNGDTFDDAIYRRLISRSFPKKPYCFFKNLCGEYHTASGFALYLAFRILAAQCVPRDVTCFGHVPAKIGSVLIYNHYQNINHSLIRLEVC
ncbi:MAG: beta-ketoacyl synthase chain length factor [Bacteroidales bacterium]|nr:beta-ketoacyl synthase chain length factor [Bacteroidales bacterium]